MLHSFYTQPFPTIIINKDFILREQQTKDTPDFLTYYSDPKVGKHILATKPTTLSEANSEINYCRSLFSHKKGIYWSLVNRANDRMIGAIGIYINAVHSRGEICYDLAYEHWNKGIMTLALKTVINYCFQHIGLVRIEASTLDSNPSSISVLKKLGFKHEGTLKKYRYFKDDFHDIEMYALIAPTKIYANNAEDLSCI